MAKKKVTELEEVQMADVESAITSGDKDIAETDLEKSEAAVTESSEGMSELALCETETAQAAEIAPDPQNSLESEVLPQTETEEAASSELTGEPRRVKIGGHSPDRNGRGKCPQ